MGKVVDMERGSEWGLRNTRSKVKSKEQVVDEKRMVNG